ncbi:T9SS type B sorting domain-containing protein [Robiginitalea sediminis]|uniref:T9SS type B sorting domain-containing protein n=1 Tax=Robiginitalea sediminis TaxID=1982593 RepID=UPI000B4A8645|nr:T9SS type B sorting domain-containing protein [Robiginitalea sediminis]
MKCQGVLWCFALVLAGFSAKGQSCPRPVFPADGQQNVPVDAAISWTAPGTATGFIVSIGTTPGGVDILTNRTSSPITSYTPEVGLPEDTVVYLSFILIRSDGSQVSCPGWSFRTAPFPSPPGCTRLVEPAEGATGYPVNDALTWAYAPLATGYRISVGTTPGGTDILDNRDVGNRLTFNPPGNFPTETDIYVSITPYNRLGPAPGTCPTQRFTTGASLVDCSFHEPTVSGFPERFSLCPGETSREISAPGLADGYNWYRLGPGGQETLIGTENILEATQTGSYRLEVYNLVGSLNEFTVCNILRDFEVVEARPPEINGATITREPDGLRIVVEVAGEGDFEYALDPDGGFQTSPVFTGLPLDTYTVYVRDRDACFVSEKTLTRRLSAADFPAFFTPNNDGYNDLWKYEPPEDIQDAQMASIHIFDRYGNLILQLDPETQGWDGKLNGRPLPSTVYWFEAISRQQQIIRGYFALKR